MSYVDTIRVKDVEYTITPNLKTVNNVSIVGSGDINIVGGSGVISDQFSSGVEIIYEGAFVTSGSALFTLPSPIDPSIYPILLIKCGLEETSNTDITQDITCIIPLSEQEYSYPFFNIYTGYTTTSFNQQTIYLRLYVKNINYSGGKVSSFTIGTYMDNTLTVKAIGVLKYE